MSQIINLRRFSKQKKKQEQAVEAAENAVKFGRTKQQKQLEADRAALIARSLEGHKRDDP